MLDGRCAPARNPLVGRWPVGVGFAGHLSKQFPILVGDVVIFEPSPLEDGNGKGRGGILISPGYHRKPVECAPRILQGQSRRSLAECFTRQVFISLARTSVSLSIVPVMSSRRNIGEHA